MKETIVVLAAALLFAGCHSAPKQTHEKRVAAKRMELQELLHNPPAMAKEITWKKALPKSNAEACAEFQRWDMIRGFFHELENDGITPEELGKDFAQALPNRAVALATAVTSGVGELDCGVWPSHAVLVADALWFLQNYVPLETAGSLPARLQNDFIRELKLMVAVARGELKRNHTAILSDASLVRLRTELGLQQIKPAELGVSKAEFDRIFWK